ncbi:hypothetical protein [Paenibacillus sp. LK1]|uniref:hypothetical protein n=1 Tax=Paenibacillus sp. LK1 TaxID=2053014 RepID=UPI000C18022B|nr:hypothetical protein [Paenibacillus sp. LK1]PIH59678.1 hypothetical protein CS562_06990 [Paenibacillus sp. LK1]
MSRFSGLSKDRLEVLDRLLSDTNILKAVVHNDTSFLDKEIPNVDDVVYKHIYPHRFIPKTADEKKTYITISFGKFRPVGTAFKSGFVTFNVITHQDLYRTDYGCMRVDFIIQKIDELINQTRGMGIGKVEFSNSDEISLNTDYHGMYITYKLCDFN